MSKKGQTVMATIDVNGTVTNKELSDAHYTVKEVRVFGDMAQVTAFHKDVIDYRVEMEMQIEDGKVVTKVSMYNRTQPGRGYFRTTLIRNRKDSISEQVLEILATL